MKHTFIGFTLLVVLSFMPFSSNAELVKGQIIFPDDTISVFLDIPTLMAGENKINYPKLHNGVVYYTSRGEESEKMFLTPNLALEYSFSFHGEEIRMLSRLNSLKQGGIYSTNGYVFFKLEVDGLMKLFSYYVRNNKIKFKKPGDDPAQYINIREVFLKHHVIQKGSLQLMFFIGKLHARYKIESYLSDCQSVLEKLPKNFVNSDIYGLVNNYNLNCASQYDY